MSALGKKKDVLIIHTGIDEWMGTYGDMVTLLLCFFVLLYASSTQDQVKMQYILQAFSTGGTFINTVVTEEQPDHLDGDGNSEIPPVNEGKGNGNVTEMGTGEQPNTFDDLFNMLAQSVSQADVADQISVEGSQNVIRISFQSDLLFDPDSAQLKAAGRDALRLVMPSIKIMAPYIGKVQVAGHTADIGKSTGVNDWDLSAARALAVLGYMDYQTIVESHKYELDAFAQYKPISPNDTPAGQAKNRRVDIIVTRNNIDPANTDVLLDILKYDYNQTTKPVDSNGNPIEEKPADDLTAADIIAGGIHSKYEGTGVAAGKLDANGNPLPVDGKPVVPVSEVGPGIPGNIFDIPDDAYYEVDPNGNPIIPETLPEPAVTEPPADTSEAGTSEAPES
ncbi:hypothetical protein FACS189499_01680 [Clostridia bacterium]|nr:hypothetical protein FACS189499_01680 [Clostridia bacterium]